MKRIRIGNDIRVQTTLHELNDFDSTAVKQVICYFIPSGEVIPEQPKTYDPAQYNICNCGKPTYNVFPCNIDAPHWFCGYNGFGVNSIPFICTKSKYTALARVLKEENRIEAYFPAKEQRYIGEYKVVFVVVMYKDGWDYDNLRTYTIDKGEVFALTSDNDDITTDTVIDLDASYITSISVPQVLQLEDQSMFELNHLDYNGVSYTIMIHYSNGVERPVTSDEFGDLFMTIIRGHSNSAISVNENGSINRNKYEDVQNEITYILKDDTLVNATMSIISVGKWHKINYTANNKAVPSTITVDGPNEIFVPNDTIDDESLSSFSVVRTPGASVSITILGASGTGCTVKKTGNNYGIYTPITLDSITINISYEEQWE